MPNHITNIVQFTDTDEKKANEIVQRVKSEISAFDFNRILPMPDELKNTRSPAKVIADEDFEKELASAEMEREKYLPGIGLPISSSMQKRFMEKYGVDNWYDWACKYWSTKWNAYDVIVSDRAFTFDTAWSTPEGVFIELSKIFPDVEFEVQYADEDVGSNCGEYTLLNGDIISECDRQGDENFACEIKGYPY